jgi:hypothetical protein
MTDGWADDFDVGRFDFALAVVMIVLGLLINLGGLGGVRVVRLDGRRLD